MKKPMALRRMGWAIACADSSDLSLLRPFFFGAECPKFEVRQKHCIEEVGTHSNGKTKKA
ncbi:hypothetical protein [Roseimicrobium gellanilyticum]|uniref:hypothetical protein n=1 Tax=Roseimicrobium gellanilyticum TaxID=748857 RepID=UPI0011BD771A|nr:hypothetical protein [Roseimicrobium gellanilyticum]